MAIPSAPQASAATRPRPSWNPPAPNTGMACPTASTAWGSSSEVGTVPVWPPPSAPWAMTASTPKSSIFSAWRRAPTVGMTSTPASCRRATVSLAGAPAKLTRRTPWATQRSMRSARSGWSGRTLTPNGAPVRSLTRPMAAASSSIVMVTAARMPNPPASLVAAVSEAPETQPMPVWTTGSRQPTRSQNRVWSRGSDRESDGVSDIGVRLVVPGRGPQNAAVAGGVAAALVVDGGGDLVQQPGQPLRRQQPVVGVGLDQVEPLRRRVGDGPVDRAVHRRAEPEAVGGGIVMAGPG